MIFREQDKHFLATLYATVAILFIWKGLWVGVYVVAEAIFPPISDPFVFLFIGLTILSISGLIFEQFDPLGNIEKKVNETLHKVQAQSKKYEFQIKYYDKNLRKSVIIPASLVKKIEKNALVIVNLHEKKEIFIPLHRVTEVIKNGKQYWRK